ncbi:MAG TPA: HAD family phosphatase [Baekduia sp.]|nr:HAD family phosphatase [Baekduia sp.]
MSRPAACVFDNDGLLLDTEEAWTRAEVTLFTRHGATFTPEHKRELIGSSHLVAAGKLEAMLGQPGEGRALMAELHELVMEEALAPVAPRPGAVALLDALADAGRPVGLASNSPRAFVQRTLRSAGLDGRFAVVLGGDEVDRPKPAPDLYLAACGRLGVAPADAVGLDDSPPGVAAVRAAGMTVVGVPYLDGLQLDADVLASSLDDPAVLAACGL